MATHPELAAEQAFVDHAYECLEESRRRARRLLQMRSLGPGGTHQARLENDVFEETARARLVQLELGDVALVFGRIDPAEGDESFHIGRLAVADERQEPVVVDWRAPVAEAFYRATGRHPMGLARRRHFVTHGRELLDIEEESFGPDGTGLVGDDGSDLVARGALITSIERARTGWMGDIVATIQVEQDEIIRDELAGVLVVQGGPGTGKTVVALHRAAYLLYTHRFPLEDQGVLVVGPNHLYIRYIERVLPSLGEAGVELATIVDLVPEPIDRSEGPGTLSTVTHVDDVARIKGDLRMVKVLAKAVRDRQRPLRQPLEVGIDLQVLRCSVEASQGIVRAARSRARGHNAGRRLVEQALWEELARSARREIDPEEVRTRLRTHEDVRAALERMWPVLTPGDLLHDLFGARGLIRSASDRLLGVEEQRALFSPRRASPAEVRWTRADAALLDEARWLLGPPPGKARKRVVNPDEDGHVPHFDPEEIRTYGHIVVDEVQDLSPMELRMLSRRSLGGSMTVVGDMAQATGPWAPEAWRDVLALLPSRKAPRIRELSVCYRTPEPIMDYAANVLAVALPGVRPPRSVRGGAEPVVVPVGRDELTSVVATTLRAELAHLDETGGGNVAVIVTDSMLAEIEAGLEGEGIAYGDASRVGLDARVSVLPMRLAKGLELDAVVVVEPARIIAEEPQGLRSLYVALTRPTRRLTIVHAEPLPDVLAELDRSGGVRGGQATGNSPVALGANAVR